MATTSIWKFKSRLKALIDYVTNEKKTNDKMYVSGINCLSNIAYQEMVNTKKQYFKTGGIECFHGYQSFASGEITPDKAHKIGVELANELWGNRFQVIVATHLNTDNIHNHFVLNSISFKDGKRFVNSNIDYKKMSKTSDTICQKYGLSVIPTKYDYTKYSTNTLYKELMKDSIDYAIENADSYNEFIDILKELDYEVTTRNNTLSLKREPYKRNTRIERQFGSRYSIDSIEKRIIETQPLFKHFPEPYLLLNQRLNYYYKIKNKYFQNKSDFSRLILHYEKVLVTNIENALKLNLKRYTPELIRDIRQMDEFSNQARFLNKNNILTEDDLVKFEKSIYEKINPLKSERENLWKKHKRANTEEKKLEIEKRIVEISKEIYPLAEDVILSKNIKNRNLKYKDIEMHQILVQEIQNINKYFKKNNKNLLK